ncbi:hypothetical protein GDO81_021423 [Engystomops pustulosus]|uniref:Uncharacterized protein n=1 Tax=Engystomops pustulosus TaxID=76066 RepID=A0AAV6ZXD7_ENGPU|nr:hypothetical protein GDO81_021423 [Engystomops pustulosus]
MRLRFLRRRRGLPPDWVSQNIWQKEREKTGNLIHHSPYPGGAASGASHHLRPLHCVLVWGGIPVRVPGHVAVCGHVHTLCGS